MQGSREHSDPEVEGTPELPLQVALLLVQLFSVSHSTLYEFARRKLLATGAKCSTPGAKTCIIGSAPRAHLPHL